MKFLVQTFFPAKHLRQGISGTTGQHGNSQKADAYNPKSEQEVRGIARERTQHLGNASQVKLPQVFGAGAKDR